jgi:hypothetical protein
LAGTTVVLQPFSQSSEERIGTFAGVDGGGLRFFMRPAQIAIGIADGGILDLARSRDGSHVARRWRKLCSSPTQGCEL